MNNPLGGSWVVQPQPTGLSPVFSPGQSPVKVLGAGVGGTQIKGVQLIQSHAPLAQPAAVIPKGSKLASKQEANESSFSKMLINKGKAVPENIQIAKIQKKTVDPTVNVPQIQVMPPTPLETIVEKTRVDVIAEPIIEQPDEKAAEVATADTPEPQTELVTDSSESAENVMPVDASIVEDSKEVTNLEETAAQDAEAEIDIELSTDTEPAEPKEDPKPEQLEDSLPVTNVSTSTNIEEAAQELSGSEPLIDDKISQDEMIQANDPVEPIATEQESLESNKDLETAIEESQEDKLELNSQEAATDLDVDVEGEKDTEQEGSSSSTPEDDPVCPENDLPETKTTQDPEVTKDLPEEADPTPGIVEEAGVSLTNTNNLQENIDIQNPKTVEDASEPVETQEPSVNDEEEIVANQNEEPTESPLAETPENVDENVNQAENSEQLDTDSKDSPQEETSVSKDAEEADEPMEPVVTSEEASLHEDQAVITSEEKDTSAQEDGSLSVQEASDVEPAASTQSTPVMELSSNEEDESLEDIEAETQDVEEANDLSVETGGEQPEEDQDNDESPVEAQISDQDSVEEIERTDDSVDNKDSSEQSDPESSEESNGGLVAPPPSEPSDEEAAEGSAPALGETDEASLVDKEAILEDQAPSKQEDVSSDNDDTDGTAGSLSDQEQIPTEDHVKDEESPVENQDCNLEANVQNGGTNEEQETLENPPNDQNVEEEKAPMTEEVEV